MSRALKPKSRRGLSQKRSDYSELFSGSLSAAEAEQTEANVVEPEAPVVLTEAPWNPDDIRISTKPFSLRHIVDMIADGELDLAPDFQRRTIWRGPQKSRLVESILLRIPLPAFYFNELDDGSMQVVDGVQRLSAVYEFSRGQISKKTPLDSKRPAPERLILEGLQYLRQLEQGGYERLTPVLRRRFDNTQIFVNIIDPQTPDTVKFDIFRRINTGGSPLNGQEIRHCVSKESSRLFLRRCAESQFLHKATANVLATNERMVDRELALRFFAFRQPDWREIYAGNQNLDDFLLTMTRRIEGLPQADLDRAFQDFEKAMLSAWKIFEGNAFRKWPLGNSRGPLNRSLFESWSVALAEQSLDSLIERQQEIIHSTRKRMSTDEEYVNSFTIATTDMRRIDARFRVAREILSQKAD